MYQYFLLTLECGHFFEQPAVQEYNGEPYSPDYVGQNMPSCEQGCLGSHKVTAQVNIPHLGYRPAEVNP